MQVYFGYNIFHNITLEISLTFIIYDIIIFMFIKTVEQFVSFKDS